MKLIISLSISETFRQRRDTNWNENMKNPSIVKIKGEGSSLRYIHTKTFVWEVLLRTHYGYGQTDPRNVCKGNLLLNQRQSVLTFIFIANLYTYVVLNIFLRFSYSFLMYSIWTSCTMRMCSEWCTFHYTKYSLSSYLSKHINLSWICDKSIPT